MKVLFVYHNEIEDGYMPCSLAVLAGKMRDIGAEVRLFDTSFWRDENSQFLQTDRNIREKLGQYKKVQGYNPTRKVVNIQKEFEKMIQEFKPTLVAATSTSREFDSLNDFILPVKQELPFLFIVGGSHPTVAPQKAIQKPAVDFVCVGEGEAPLAELVRRLRTGEDLRGIPGILAKSSDGTVTVSKIGIQSGKMDDVPEPNWDIFDERHMIRPYEGELKKYGFWEASRGCPYSCSYCNNSKLHQIESMSGLSQDRPGMYRFHSPSVIIDRMERYKERYEYNHVQFIDENMPTMPAKSLREFASAYKKRIGLGFFTQTRPEHFAYSTEKAEILADMGCLQLGMGAESGNAWLRKTILNRPMKDGVLEKACETLKSVGIKVSLYYIIGFPEETKEMVEETIALHDRIRPNRHSVRFLQLYPGTPIRDYCIQRGYVSEDFVDQPETGGYLSGPTICFPSPPHPTRDELIQLRDRFVSYA